jgi:hypothetical protein
MDRSEDPGEGTRTDHVQYFVMPVKKAKPLASEHSVQLEVGQNAFPQQQILHLFERDLARSNFAPKAIDLILASKLEIYGSLCQ